MAVTRLPTTHATHATPRCSRCGETTGRAVMDTSSPPPTVCALVRPAAGPPCPLAWLATHYPATLLALLLLLFPAPFGSLTHAIDRHLTACMVGAFTQAQARAAARTLRPTPTARTSCSDCASSDSTAPLRCTRLSRHVRWLCWRWCPPLPLLLPLSRPPPRPPH